MQSLSLIKLDWRLHFIKRWRFKITDAELHAPIFTLSTKDNANLTKQLSDRFKRSVYWNSYQTIPAKVIDKEKNIYELLNAWFQRVKRLCVLAYANPTNAANDETDIKNNRKYFLARAQIKNYNILIDRRKFYDQPINDLIRHSNEVRKVLTGQGDDYTTEC